MIRTFQRKQQVNAARNHILPESSIFADRSILGVCCIVEATKDAKSDFLTVLSVVRLQSNNYLTFISPIFSHQHTFTTFDIHTTSSQKFFGKYRDTQKNPREDVKKTNLHPAAFEFFKVMSDTSDRGINIRSTLRHNKYFHMDMKMSL